MLGLSRRAGESLTVGDDIRIQVVSAHGGVVRLSIEATTTMQIRRAELPPAESARHDGLDRPEGSIPYIRPPRARGTARASSSALKELTEERHDG
jgi:carbon storage regulator CsrA